MENSSAARNKPNNQTAVELNCDGSSFGRIFLPVSYSALFLLTLAGNLSLLLHYLRKEKSSSKCFIANLATLDLLMALTLPLTVDYHLQGGSWRFGEALCLANVTLFYGNLYGGSLFMLCISVERLVSVRYPVAYEKWLKRRSSRRLVCLCVWLIIAALVLWGSVSVKVLNSQPDGSLACGHRFPDEQWLRLAPLLVVWTAIGFLLPYVTVVVCYGLIVRWLAATRPVQPRWKSKSMRTIFILIAIMTICFLPFNTVQMVNAARRWNSGPRQERSSATCFGHRFLVLMASLNSALDPFVYYFLSYSLKINRLCQSRWN